jgi:hypothetical protein
LPGYFKEGENMGLDLWAGICMAIIVISGGIIARVKGDYFSRGMGISFLTNIFGIVTLISSRPSRARANDDDDIHGWPPTAYLAVLAQMLLVLILLLRFWFS